MRYLPVYKEWAKANEQTAQMYLCNFFDDEADEDFLNLIKPTESDENELWAEGHAVFAWGQGDIRKRYNDYEPYTPFTPLRRNLLLLMAAMNNEL